MNSNHYSAVSALVASKVDTTQHMEFCFIQQPLCDYKLSSGLILFYFFVWQKCAFSKVTLVHCSVHSYISSNVCGLGVPI